MPSGSKEQDNEYPKPSFRLINIEFEGAKRTRPSLLAKFVADVFAAKSLEDCLLRANTVRQKLGSLFSGVSYKLEPVDGSDHVLTFVVSERNRARLRSSLEVDNQVSSYATFELAAPNLNGIGDSLSCRSKNRLSKDIPAFEFEYMLPFTPWRTLYSPVYSIVISHCHYPSLPSSYDLENKAIINSLEFFSNPYLKHSLGLINTWSHIRSSSSVKTPIEIREQTGHFLKSYIRYGLSYDSRRGGSFPYDGILVKLTNDMTTNFFVKGARFARQELQIELNKLLLPQYGLLGQINLFAGNFFRANKLDISDKFFPGGVPTLRGFDWKGFGPNVRRHPFGVTSYLTAGIHLYPILPSTLPDSWINDVVRPHVFVNAGTSGDLKDIKRISSHDDLRNMAASFKESLRFTYGFGVVICIAGIYFEMNYCAPLSTKDGDSTRNGFECGIRTTIG